MASSVRARAALQPHCRCRRGPFDGLARRFLERIIRLVTDPTVKVRRISREVNFFSSQWTLERRGKFLEKIAALVIDLDCARQLAGSALWGSAPELLNI